MYNSIYPVNINYVKHNKIKSNGDSSNAGSDIQKDVKNGNYSFPNGTKPTIDYTSGQINISQVITDFRNTIIAINTPKDISDEVNIYLKLVEKESLKENPSKEIVLSNLRNASKLCDGYITDSLKKPSNVVEGWIDALFLQKINLKANPNEVNPDFLLEFPKNAQEKIQEYKLQSDNESSFLTVTSGQTSDGKVLNQDNTITSSVPDVEVALISDNNTEPISETIHVESNIDESEEETPEPLLTVEQVADGVQNAFSPLSKSDILARELFIQAKNEPKDNIGDTKKLNLLNEALGVIEQSDNTNSNIKAAIHFERGKVFDEYDYVDYALRDYYEATSAIDNNLKAQAYYKSAKIYDEFSEFSPALDNYLSCVAYSGQAENFNAQSLALSSIAGLYAGQYDIEKTEEFTNLALDTISESKDDELIAKTHSLAAENYKQAGSNEKALSHYKNALQAFVRNDESYEQIAYNYEQASIVMEKLGNIAKAKKLQAKADLYRQKAQQQQAKLEEAS